jgi:hypothetical protein
MQTKLASSNYSTVLLCKPNNNKKVTTMQINFKIDVIVATLKPMKENKDYNSNIYKLFRLIR